MGVWVERNGDRERRKEREEERERERERDKEWKMHKVEEVWSACVECMC